MIEKWKLSLEKFLEEYEDNDDVIGAMLVGSYATGNQNDNSDIDVQILLKDDANYTERGNKEVNSFLIEYFMNPSWKVKEYLQQNHEKGMNTMANMYCYGKVIFDLEGKAKELQELATTYIDKPLKTITEDELSELNYHIWDYYDELKNLLYEKSPSFDFIYYELVDMIINSYYKFLEIPRLPKTKIYKILTNDTFREKYHIFNLPEKEFIDLYVKCFNLNTKKEMYENVTKLIEYYYNKTGKFNINNYVQRNTLY